MDLDKLNLVKQLNCGLDLGLSQFFLLTQLPQKANTCWKSGQTWPENDHFGSYVYICDTLSLINTKTKSVRTMINT